MVIRGNAFIVVFDFLGKEVIFKNTGCVVFSSKTEGSFPIRSPRLRHSSSPVAGSRNFRTLPAFLRETRDYSRLRFGTNNSLFISSNLAFPGQEPSHFLSFYFCNHSFPINWSAFALDVADDVVGLLLGQSSTRSQPGDNSLCNVWRLSLSNGNDELLEFPCTLQLFQIHITAFAVFRKEKVTARSYVMVFSQAHWTLVSTFLSRGHNLPFEHLCLVIVDHFCSWGGGSSVDLGGRCHRS